MNPGRQRRRRERGQDQRTVVAAVLDAGLGTVVAADKEDEWLAWLAALDCSGALGVELDPRTLTGEEVAGWRERVHGPGSPELRCTSVATRLWLLRPTGERVGFIDLGAL